MQWGKKNKKYNDQEKKDYHKVKVNNKKFGISKKMDV